MDKAIIKITNGKVYTPEGVKPNTTIIVKDGKIAEISDSPIDINDALVIDAKGTNIVPGGIDLHIHGGGGRDFMEGSEEAFRTAMAAHIQYGTTAFLPTLSSCSVDMIMTAAKTSEKIMKDPDTPMIGLHLEGPYFNPAKVGAQIPKYVTPPIKKDYEYILNNTDVVRRWDSAPELPGTEAFGKCLSEHGVLASIGHTIAEFPDVKKAFDAGYTHATHFYNAMTGFHNVREYKHEGTVESIYAIPEMTVELVADGIHVPPTILRMVWMLKGVEKTALITDALACSASDSQKVFDPRVIIEDGVCKLSDRSALAGSIATMDRLVKTMVQKADIPFYDVIRMTAETPARIMNVLDHKGTLSKGKDADIVFYDDNIDLKFVMQKGHIARNDLQ